MKIIIFLFVSVNKSHLSGLNGSPILDKKGQVVGVFNLSIPKLASSIKINHLQNFINKDVGEICNARSFKVCKEAEIKNLKNLAEEASVSAQYQLAIIKRDYEQDSTKAIDLFEKTIEQGYLPAQFQMAQMYYYGKGVFQDFEKAFDWYKKLAEQGHTEAQYTLANLHHVGVGTTKNQKEALKWYQKAAGKDHISAQYNLAFMYRFARGTKKDLKTFKYWLKQAARQDDRDAQHQLAVIAYNNKKYREAFNWFKKAAMQGHTGAQQELAQMYKKGIGINQNPRMAEYWFEQSNLNKLK